MYSCTEWSPLPSRRQWPGWLSIHTERHGKMQFVATKGSFAFLSLIQNIIRQFPRWSLTQQFRRWPTDCRWPSGSPTVLYNFLETTENVKKRNKKWPSWVPPTTSLCGVTWKETGEHNQTSLSEINTGLCFSKKKVKQSKRTSDHQLTKRTFTVEKKKNRSAQC